MLLIEDNPGDARLIREMLSEADGGTSELECEETLASGLERLGKERFDVLLLDLTLPDSRGLETLHKARPLAQNVPVVVLTGLEDEETARKALESGAQDYLVKGKITADFLGRTIRYALARHSAEEALRANEAYHRALMEQTMDCITVIDENGMIVYESPSITPLLGYSQEELVGRNVFDLIHAEDAPAAVEAFMEGIQASAGYSVHMEVRFKHKDGSWRTFWGVGRNLLDDPDVGGIILDSRDITERKLAEEAIKRLASRLMEESDRVRVTIAADLHDDVGQSLNAIKLAFDMQCKKMAGGACDETRERMSNIRDMLSETIDKIRNITVNLVPAALTDIGLDSALQSHLEEFARETGATCEFKTEGAHVEAGVEVKMAIFRIAQEALANVREHSKASSVEISTSWSDSLVSLSVRDDGVGFDVETAYEESRTGEHFGLLGMRERARVLEGEFVVESEPGEGTTVTVSVPLERG